MTMLRRDDSDVDVDGCIAELRRSGLDVRDDGATTSVYSRDASNMSQVPLAVVFPATHAEVVTAVRVITRHGIAVIPRGSGTGLAGGAVPDPASIVLSVARMAEANTDSVSTLRARVQTGVLNLDVTRAVSADGLLFAPDPSSQQSCSIGGNIANNSGGPHCLADGVTSAHVHAIDVVLSDGHEVTLGGDEPEPPGYDLRGAFVGSEGMFGVATAALVKLQIQPPAVRTLLAAFHTVEDGARAVTAVIAAGFVPAALEMMDALITRAVEEFVHAGFPTDAAAVLIVEVAGMEHGVEADADEISHILSAEGAYSLRVAESEAERALIWKGRKNAFGAIARIKPNYYLHDTVVPRSQLPAVLARVYEIAHDQDLIVMNVFHAGDGNLHPLLVFDKREPGVMERVHRAGEEIVALSIEVGGVLSGEHGIGFEKRDYMGLMFTDDDLRAQQLLRAAFDPSGLMNPHKVLPRAAGCGDMQHVPPGAWV